MNTRPMIRKDMTWGRNTSIRCMLFILTILLVSRMARAIPSVVLVMELTAVNRNVFLINIP